MAVPMLLTGVAPDDYRQAATSPSVLAALRASGFITAWLSNQDTTVFNESGHDYYWTVGDTAALSGGYDEALIPVARSFVAPLWRQVSAVKAPRAAVIHTMGSHFEYANRYPPSLYPAEPEKLSLEALASLRYGRAVDYSAKVMLSFANILDEISEPAYLVFSGDHGENLPMDRNGLIAHLGARASIHDGTTTSLVLWNRAMRNSNRPQRAIAGLVAAPLISHADITRLFLALAGFGEIPVQPVSNPRILAPVDADAGRSTTHPCAALRP